MIGDKLPLPKSNAAQVTRRIALFTLTPFGSARCAADEAAAWAAIEAVVRRRDE